MKYGFMQTIADRIEKTMTIKNVYGDPIERDGRMIIPVARVAYGLGGGFGNGPSQAEGGETPASQGGEGEGGGAGGIVTPLGVLEITPEGTTFLPITNVKNVLLAAVFGLLIGIFLGKRLK